MVTCCHNYLWIEHKTTPKSCFYHVDWFSKFIQSLFRLNIKVPMNTMHIFFFRTKVSDDVSVSGAMDRYVLYFH